MAHVELPPPAPRTAVNLLHHKPERLYALPLWLGGAVVALDQVAKALVRWNLALHESVTVIPGVLDITYVRNTGAAFGILNAADFPFKPAVMLTIALLAFGAIAYFATRLAAHEVLARAGLTLVLAGAVGNLIDRATVGYVVDFVDVYWRDWHFWAFNVSDSAITIGAGLVILDLLVTGRHASRTV
jgi:signal peptidase II